MLLNSTASFVFSCRQVVLTGCAACTPRGGSLSEVHCCVAPSTNTHAAPLHLGSLKGYTCHTVAWQFGPNGVAADMMSHRPHSWWVATDRLDCSGVLHTSCYTVYTPLASGERGVSRGCMLMLMAAAVCAAARGGSLEGCYGVSVQGEC